MEEEFKIGDEVRIVNYGHLIWENKNCDSFNEKTSFKIYKEDDNIRYVDVNYHLVGKKAIIIKIMNTTDNKKRYALSKVSKVAWYNQDQLEKIK